MCLNCMYYLETCSEPACYEQAEGIEKYTGKNLNLFLWTGGDNACEHIRAGHGPACELFSEVLECNCDYRVGADGVGVWLYPGKLLDGFEKPEVPDDGIPDWIR